MATWLIEFLKDNGGKYIRLTWFSIAVLMVMGCNISRSLLYYPQSISEKRLEYINKNYTDVSEQRLSTVKNVRLHGWLIKKNMQKLPTVFYFGGNAEEVSLNIEDFHERINANFVLFNYRGYGLSTGKPSETALKQDAQEIFEYFSKEYSLKKEHIFVMGRSLGSGIAMFLAANNAVHKVILISPYCSIAEVAYDHFPDFLVNLMLSDRWETSKLVERIQSPVLLLAASDDEIIHFRHTRKLYESIGSEKKLIRIENCGHNTISFRLDYWKELNDFIGL